MEVDTLVYFHGIPGSPAELSLASNARWAGGLRVIALDRHALAISSNPDAYLGHLAELVGAMANGARLRLVGFSLGAAAALRVASILKDRVASLDLISPAGPLSLGEFVPQMQGGKLFALARDHLKAFRVLTGSQAVLARFAPRILAGAMLRGAQGGDASLASNPQFRDLLATMLQQSFDGGALAYRTEIASYVADWKIALQDCPVSIWQGDADNWTPPEMARCLAKEIGPNANIEWVAGGSHYSTLSAYLNRFSNS